MLSEYNNTTSGLNVWIGKLDLKNRQTKNKNKKTKTREKKINVWATLGRSKVDCTKIVVCMVSLNVTVYRS